MLIMMLNMINVNPIDIQCKGLSHMIDMIINNNIANHFIHIIFTIQSLVCFIWKKENITIDC